MSLPDTTLCRVADLVGTPAYVYDAAELRNGVARLKTALPQVEFIYSLKANPNASVVGVLTSQGIGAEVCSLFELEVCLMAGVPPEDILFVGPAKSKEELERAISLGIKAIAAESLRELELINDLACAAGKRQDVALRINPAFHVPGARLSMSGKPTQFGIDEADLEAALAILRAAKGLRLAGMHIYMGTRILDHQVIVQNSIDILKLARRVTELAGRPLDFVDIGGGFGVPYHAKETALDLAALGDAMAPVLAEAKADMPRTRIVIELGRYMVATAGSFLTRVRYTKASKGKNFAICDGGSNCHTAAGQAALYRKNFPMAKVAAGDGETGPWSISGPLCTPTDVIGTDVEMEALHPGDLVRVDNSGAYGPTASPVNFLSFGMPFEVMADGPVLDVIRERPSLAAFLKAQTPRRLETPTRNQSNKEVADHEPV